MLMLGNILYRNFLESKGPFYNGKDKKGLYNEIEAVSWYEENKKFMKTISIKRPPNKLVEITIPIKEAKQGEVVKENDTLLTWMLDNKAEARLTYVVNQIMDEYIMDDNGCFYKRDKKRGIKEDDFGVYFAMREVIEGLCRTSPISVHVLKDKDTQKSKFIPRQIGQNVGPFDFHYKGQKYSTNFFGLYSSRFRDAIFPESNFDGYTLQKRQRDAYIKRGRITVLAASRASGKSQSSTAFVTEYLFKELNMKHEMNRPFLIIYGGLSKSANLQVVEYMLAAFKKLTTNKNVIKWSAQDQILTLYDGHNERKIKFVSQGQEGEGFRGLRPHLIILDEAARLSKEMFNVANGTNEASIMCISTINYEDRKNWFYKILLEAQKQQRSYTDVYELIAEIRIKHGMHLIKTEEEFNRKMKSGIIDSMRDMLYDARPLVGLKYTIDDVEYIPEHKKQEMVDLAMLDGEDVCLAEYYSEYADNKTVFSIEGRLDSTVPEKYDYIAYGFDEAEEHDNPAIVFAGVLGKKVYVLHSEILNKSDYIARYDRINALKAQFGTRTLNSVISVMDLTRLQQVGLREARANIGEIDYPILYTPSQQQEIKRKFPFFLIGKRYLVSLVLQNFFEKDIIRFHAALDKEEGLFAELSTFKYQNKGRIEGSKHAPDDQVNAMLIVLFALWYHVIRNNIESTTLDGDSIEERLYRKQLSRFPSIVDKDISNIINNYR